MLYLKRKIDFFLSAWKSNPDRKPLIVKGPRQVGKTESIRRFGEQNYKSVISINFVEEPKYKMITTDGYKAEGIIKNISRIDPSKRFIEGETLLFFDELQEFPEIATALKFLYGGSSCPLGSLLLPCELPSPEHCRRLVLARPNSMLLSSVK